MVVYAAVAAYAAFYDRDLAGAVAVPGVLGLVLLVYVLLRAVEELLPWSLGLLGGEYLVALLARSGPVDGAAALVAGGLLLSGELATWSIHERVRVVAPREMARDRAIAVALLVAVGLAASAIVMSFSAVPLGRSLFLTLLGAIAVVVIAGAAARLARRGRLH